MSFLVTLTHVIGWTERLRLLMCRIGRDKVGCPILKKCGGYIVVACECRSLGSVHLGSVLLVLQRFPAVVAVISETATTCSVKQYQLHSICS